MLKYNVAGKKLFTIRTVPSYVQDFNYLRWFCTNFIFSQEEVQYLRTDVVWRVTRGVTIEQVRIYGHTLWGV